MDKLKFWPDDGDRWEVNVKLHGSWGKHECFTQISWTPSCSFDIRQDISPKNTNVNLSVSTREKSGGHTSSGRYQCLNQIWWTSISGDTKAVSEQSCWSCCSEFTYFLFSSACRYVAFYSFIDITDTSKHHDRWILLFLLTTSCLNQTGYFQSVRTCLTWTVFCCVLHNCMKGKLRTISKE